jgi:hypothetical protein
VRTVLVPVAVPDASGDQPRLPAEHACACGGNGHRPYLVRQQPTGRNIVINLKRYFTVFALLTLLFAGTLALSDNWYVILLASFLLGASTVLMYLSFVELVKVGLKKHRENCRECAEYYRPRTGDNNIQ